jgi:hypothetical protein
MTVASAIGIPCTSKTRTRPSKNTKGPVGRRLASVPVRGRFQFDLFDTQQTAPVGLVLEAILKGSLCVLLAEADVDRLRIARPDKRVQTHRGNRIRRDKAEQGLRHGRVG